MASPSLLCVDQKGSGAAMNPSLLRGGLFRESLGAPFGVNQANPALTYFANTLVRFRGRLYYIGQAYINQYDPDTNTWITVYGGLISQISSTASYGFHTGFLEYMRSDRVDTEIGLWFRGNAGNTNRTGFARSANGTTWSYVWSAGSGGSGQPCAGAGQIDFNGYVYGRCWGTTANSSLVYDPVANLVATQNQLFTNYKRGAFFILDERLFYIAPQNGTSDYTQNAVEELVLGSWVARLTGSVRFGSNIDGNCSAMRYGEDVVVFGPYQAGTGAVQADGLACFRFYVSAPGGALLGTDQSTSVVPASIRHGGATIGNPLGYVTTCFVDSETDPANPKHYVMFQAGDLSEAVTLFQFNGFSSPMTVVGSPQASGDYSFPSLFFGGGGCFNGLGGSTPMISGRVREANKGLIGLELVYELRGDPTRLDHGTVTSGPFTVGETVTGGTSGATGVVDYEATVGLYLLLDESISATAFQAGETITGGSSGASAVLEHVLPHGLVTSGPFEVTQSILGGTSGATGVITEVGLDYIKVDTVAGGPFQATETITQTTGPNTGAAATTTAAAPLGSTGGAADKIVQFRYYYGPGGEGQGVPASGLCTLVPATLTGGGTLISGNTQISDVAAADRTRGGDPVTRSIEWDFLSDGLPEGLVDRIQLEAIRP